VKTNVLIGVSLFKFMISFFSLYSHSHIINKVR